VLARTLRQVAVELLAEVGRIDRRITEATAALSAAVIAEIQRATPGRDYYQRKRAAGKTHKKCCDASPTSSTAP
jgi:hypothetical protein